MTSAAARIALNPKQLQAAHSIAGPVLVLAGAGSGKTGVITSKIAYLIEDCHYSARHVVALTFTNKAAREMKERVGKLLKKSASKGLWVSTFHTLGLRILKEDSQHIGLRRGFAIFDQRDCFEILKEITALSDDELKKLQTAISHYKNDFSRRDEHDANVVRIAEHYNQHLLALNAVDFDDLIVHCLSLFRDQPTVLEKWQQRIHYLLLDEYQDTNQSQYQLVKYLVGLRAQFTAVGDDDQSIYSWRGAEAENLQQLSKDYPNLQVVKLEQNYRCDQAVLSASNALIAHNPHLFEKQLWSKISTGNRINVYACHTDDEEAQTLITKLLTHKNIAASQFSDYAILYRSNFQSRILEKHLRLQRVPYVINGATSFFEHAEVRDLLAYLRVIANPDDQRAFVRVINTPKREIGTVTLQKLNDYATHRQIGFLSACLEYGLSQVMPKSAQETLYEFACWIQQLQQHAEQGMGIAELLGKILDDCDYLAYVRSQYDDKKAARRLGLIDELRDWLVKLEENEDLQDLSDILQRLQLIDMLDRKTDEDESQDAVKLMTLHAAKGLEFPYVFIVGLEEGLLPHQNCLADEAAIEEERRLLYVGITRTQYQLWLSLSQNRRVAGQMTGVAPSRYLDELPADEIVWEGINEAELSPDEHREQLDSLFADLLSIVDNSD